MTISGERALAIASAASEQEGWGIVPADEYEPFKFDFEVQPAWEISLKEIAVGFQVRFVIDAETGVIRKKVRLGSRRMA
jgi:hypothetical protein